MESEDNYVAGTYLAINLTFIQPIQFTSVYLLISN